MSKITCLTQQRVIKPETVHPAVIDDGENLILVDCGDPELAYVLMDEMRSKGLSPERLTHIIITHHDLDHVGGLSQFRDACPNVNVMATAEQAEYISGRSRWLRLQEEDRLYLALPPEKRIPSSRVRAAQYVNFLPANVDTVLQGDEFLPLCGGIQIVSTPWHMPGHISVYIPGEKALITGDAINTFDGKIDITPHLNLNADCTAEGLLRLAELDVEHIYGYHGGELSLTPGAFRKQILTIHGKI